MPRYYFDPFSLITVKYCKQWQGTNIYKGILHENTRQKLVVRYTAKLAFYSLIQGYL